MTNETRKFVTILVAAGRGLRAGGGTPKQWRALGHQRVADWTLSAFDRFGPIVVVLHPDDLGTYLPDQVHRVLGGESRSLSVKAGLTKAWALGASHVLIHDIARPCVTGAVIDDVIKALTQGADAAAPGIPVNDALWRVENGQVAGIQDRAQLWRAQTPQGFTIGPIAAAHDGFEGDAADDVEVARSAGLIVTLTRGDEDNIKITHPQDFVRAERILHTSGSGAIEDDLTGRPGETNLDIRIGNGYDVHAFEDGDHVILCGVKIPHDRALKGHSDADVGMHAITDAIYGALAQGDIGRHFPPSDPQWKGTDSRVFLDHAVKLAADLGYNLSNVDLTLVCEHPKIGPHACEMQRVLAQITGLSTGRISVKATTSEKLGFTGRSEGIAAMATALVVSK